MTEKSEKKVKGFRIGLESHSIVDQLIEESGKDPGEWFEELVQKLKINELVLDKEAISSNLRKHFSSDVAALKDATNLITNLFLNQMTRITVERNNWNDNLQKTVQEHEDKQKKQKEQIQQLEEVVQTKDLELEEAMQNILQLQTKVEGFDKLEIQLRKDIERLEKEKESTVQEIQQIKTSHLSEKDQLQKNIEELKLNSKEEKDRLNQQIVDYIDKLKQTESIIKENESLKTEAKELQSTIRENSMKFEVNLTRIEEQAEVDKQKALLERERELRDQLHGEYRKDTKELYEKIEHLQLEVQKLQMENNSLMNKGPKK